MVCYSQTTNEYCFSLKGTRQIFVQVTVFFMACYSQTTNSIFFLWKEYDRSLFSLQVTFLLLFGLLFMWSLNVYYHYYHFRNIIICVTVATLRFIFFVTIIIITFQNNCRQVIYHKKWLSPLFTTIIDIQENNSNNHDLWMGEIAVQVVCWFSIY